MASIILDRPRGLLLASISNLWAATNNFDNLFTVAHSSDTTTIGNKNHWILQGASPGHRSVSCGPAWETWQWGSDVNTSKRKKSYIGWSYRKRHLERNQTKTFHSVCCLGFVSIWGWLQIEDWSVQGWHQLILFEEEKQDFYSIDGSVNSNNYNIKDVSKYLRKLFPN